MAASEKLTAYAAFGDHHCKALDEWLKDHCKDGDSLKVIAVPGNYVWLQNMRANEVYMTDIAIPESGEPDPR